MKKRVPVRVDALLAIIASGFILLGVLTYFSIAASLKIDDISGDTQIIKDCERDQVASPICLDKRYNEECIKFFAYF